MKAQNEAEVLEHMAIQFKGNGGKLSGLLNTWTDAKLTALRKMQKHALATKGREVQSVIDVGIGDLDVMRRWEDFETVDYIGIEGCPEIIEKARAEFPEKHFEHMTFGEIDGSGFSPLPDAIFLLDILYHIPDEKLAKRLVRWAVSSPAEYLVVSYSTDQQQQFDFASKVGEAGFAWFPWEFRRPTEFSEVVYTVDSKQGLQSQRCDVLARTSR